MEASDLQTVQQAKICLYTDSTADHCQINGIVGVAQLVISNIYCKVFLRKDNIENGDIISIQSLPKGVYIVKIISDHGIVRRKLEKR